MKGRTVAITKPTGTSFIILDESGVVTVYVPCRGLINPDETYASYTHVLTDDSDLSSPDSSFPRERPLLWF